MKLLTVREATEKLGMCESTLRKRMIEDQWPFYDLGPKGFRLDVDEILKLTRRPKGRDEVMRKPRKSAKLGGRRGVKKLEGRAVNE